MAELDLNKVVQKFQQKLANADLALAVAETRNEQLQEELQEAAKKNSELEAEIEKLKSKK